jgi:hypothetical protein
MICYLLLLYLINNVYSFEPPCTTCKFFIPNTLNTNLGLCRLFQENIYDDNNKEYIVNNVALQCRNNQILCGKEGKLHQSVNTKFKNYEYIRRITNDEYEYEKDWKNLENTEKELVEIFKQMRKDNIYRKTKDFMKYLSYNHKLLK